MARRKSGRTRLRLAGAALLIALLGGAWAWWHLHHWTPDRAAYPLQGVEIGSQDAGGGDGSTDWPAIKAIGADFAYIDASASAFARDPRFSATRKRRAPPSSRSVRSTTTIHASRPRSRRPTS